MKTVVIKEKLKKVLNIIFIIFSVILLFSILYINIFPFLINALIFISLFFLNIIFIKHNNKVEESQKNNLIRIIIIVLCLFIDLTLIKTCLFFNKITTSNYENVNYIVLVSRTSEISKIKQIKDKKIGYYNIDNGILLKLKKTNEYISYDNIFDLYKSLGKETSAILIEESLKNIIDENSFLNNNTKEIGILNEKRELVVSKENNITTTPFNVYISGIDTYGAINSVSRSDANLILTVNPITHKILITSIPRDYYVKLHSKKGNNDKLTHASIYGIMESITTIEDLLKTKIDYYIKVNFTSVIDLVDELGGIDVLSEHEFTSVDGYNYKKGYNNLNGEKALSFIRERYAFIDGDKTRGRNQQEFLKSLISAFTKPKLLIKYNTILDKMKNKISTNISVKDISSLIKMQLTNNTKWDVVVNNLDGENSYAYTYTYPKEKLYVMLPNNGSLVNAINKIKEIEGE